jgi:hypothetical protein
LVVAVVVIVAADDKSDVAAVVLLVEIDQRPGGHNNYYYGPGRLDGYSQRHLWVVAERMDSGVRGGTLHIHIAVDNHIDIHHVHIQTGIHNHYEGLFVPALVVSPSPYWCLCTFQLIPEGKKC